MRKVIISFVLISILTLAIRAQEIVNLYSGKIPNSKSSGVKETYVSGIFRGVTTPTLEIYLPEKEKATGTAVIICPGGGYSLVVYQGEGISTAKEFANSKTIWSKLKTGDFSVYFSSWALWYNLHKMYAGLRDAWLYAGNEDAKIMFLKFCDWGISITSFLTDAQMESMLDTEHGGMKEIFADAYQMTGDQKYLIIKKGK